MREGQFDTGVSRGAEPTAAPVSGRIASPVSLSATMAVATMTVLYRDAQLLAVSKPSGLLVHNGWGREADVALGRARRIAGQYVYPVHRLDRGTSGVLLFALSSDAAKEMQRVLHAPTTRKMYVALVRGITPEVGVIDHPLAKYKGAEKREAVTRFWRLGTFERYSLVLASPLSGRLHQIRRHMKHVSHPLIGDVRYGKREHNHKLRARFGLARLALHALSYSFIHPRSNTCVTLHAHLPADLLGPLGQMGLLESVPKKTMLAHMTPVSHDAEPTPIRRGPPG